MNGVPKERKKTPSVPSGVYFEKFSFPKVLTKGILLVGRDD